MNTERRIFGWVGPGAAFNKWACCFGLLLFLGNIEDALSSPPTLTTTAVSAGDMDGLALRSDGTVWAWGTNRIGELGVGTTASTLFPMHVSRMSNIVGIAAGPLHSLAVQSNGTVWAWGTNGGGQLGI